MGWFGSLKKCVLVIVWFDFEKLEKKFCCTLLSNMYVCELLKDHIILRQSSCLISKQKLNSTKLFWDRGISGDSLRDLLVVVNLVAVVDFAHVKIYSQGNRNDG